MARRIGFLAILAAVGVWWTQPARGQGIRIGDSAPEITAGAWINSDPLTIVALRGRVVFVEFWTYG